MASGQISRSSVCRAWGLSRSRLSARGARLPITACGLEICLYREGSQHLLGRLRREQPPSWPQPLTRQILSGLEVEQPPIRWRSLRAGLVAVSLLGMVLGVSRWDGPVWQPPAPALIRVVVRTVAPLRWSRALTAEEQARLLPHTRSDRPISDEQ